MSKKSELQYFHFKFNEQRRSYHETLDSESSGARKDVIIQELRNYIFHDKMRMYSNPKTCKICSQTSPYFE